MRRKFLVVLLSVVSAVCLALGLAACGKSDDETTDWENGIYTVQTAYAEAQELGYSGSLEEFIASITGADGQDGTDGVGITNITINDSGELIITLTSGSPINLGKINGSDGVGISTATIKDGKLILTLTDGSTIDCGTVVGSDGADGADGNDGKDGADGSDGNDGVGISNVTINASGNLIITYTNGNSSDLGNITGDTGATGVGIFNIDINTNGELVITLTDNTQINCGVVVGADDAKGEDGSDGDSVSSASIDTEGNLVLTFTSGNSITVGNVVGTNGENGADGVGIKTVVINDSGELVITFTNGEDYNLGCVTGSDGEKGEDGEDGVGIASVTLDENSQLVFEYTDGSTNNLGVISSCGHVYGGWVTGAEATCTSMGYKYHTCTACGYVEYEFTSALGHTPDEYQCDESFHYYICTECGLYITQKHDYNDNLTCTICGYSAAYSVGLVYTLNSNKQSYTVSGIGTCTDTDIIIPSTYNGLPVTAVGRDAFDGNKSITSVTIGSNVTSIGSYAFRNCYKLIEVYNLSALELTAGSSNNGYVAYYAKNVYTTSGGSNLIYNNNYVFYNDSGTYYLMGYFGTGTDITLPTSISGNSYAIYMYAFYNNASLTSVNISDGITAIGDYALCDCTSLTSASIGDSLTNIGSYAFRDCSLLSDIIMGSSVDYIGTGAFYNCSSLTEITLPDTLVDTNLRDHAFYGCTSLASINIPDGITNISNETFYGCTSLSSITIPSSVTTIGYNAFYNCSEYANVYYGGTASQWTSISFGSSAANPLNRSGNLYLSGYLVTDISLDTNINGYAFYGCTSLKSVAIGDSVTSIGSYAFEGCTSLTSVNYGGTASQWASISFGYSIANPLYYAGKLYLSNKLAEDITVDSDVSGYAFYGCTSITSVTIGSGVTSIGSCAFQDCTSLTKVSYGSTISDWANITFDNLYSNPLCNGCDLYLNGEIVEDITLDSTVNAHSFIGCTSLKSVTIGDDVTAIGDYAFYDCSALTAVTVGNGVTSIKTNMFSGCSSLESITIGSGVTSIGSDMFNGFTSLTTITVNSSNTAYKSIDGNLYSYDGNELIKYASGKTASSFTIPDGVTTIGNYAFYDCSSLEGIIVPESVTSVSGDPFNGCTLLAGVYITKVSAWCGITFASYTSNPLYYAGNLYLYSSTTEKYELVTDLVIPDTVTSISSYAFCGGTCFTSVTVPDSVTTIGSYVFYGCPSLVSITIPFVGSSASATGSFYYLFGDKSNIPTTLTTVTITGGSIPSDAFVGCTSLTNIIIGDGVTSIGKTAFYYCTLLESITIGNGVTSIGSSAFGTSASSGCTALTSVYYSGTASQWASISFDNSLANPLYYAGNLYIDGTLATDITLEDITAINTFTFYYCTSLTSVTIGDSVTSIGKYAFGGCASLTNVTLGSGIESIGEGAFSNCSALTSITIPDSVSTIGVYAFSNCSSLTSITIPDSVTTIGGWAFQYCTSLTDVTIGNGVTTIGAYSFDNSALENVYYNGTASQWASILFVSETASPMRYADNLYLKDDSSETGYSLATAITIEGITAISDYAFDYCSSITSITISNDVTSIGKFAFTLTSITSITLPDSVTFIDSYAFYDTQLTSITIPESVTFISESAFYCCLSLTSVTFENTSGWYVSTSSALTGGTEVDVSDISQNVTYLIDTYTRYYWYRIAE